MLNGILLLNVSPFGTMLAAELSDAQGLNDICAKWKLDARIWSRRVKQVAEHETIARALGAVVREFWSYNEAFERALGKLP